MHSSTSLRVAIIVLNWNRKLDTLRCLESLRESTYPASQVFMVDNASTDGTVAAVRAHHPEVRIVQNPKNLGFAEGNNAAMRLALQEGFDAVMLLNNDTVVAPEAIELLVEQMRSNPRIGVVGPAITYLSRPDRVWSAGGSINWKRGEVNALHVDTSYQLLPDEPYQVDHVSGCCMLVRAGAIQQAGMLDPRFFMYYEETDWCVRIARAGFEVFVSPAARIWHDVSPDTHLNSKAIAYFMTRNHLLFLRNAGAPPIAWLHTVYRQCRTLCALMIRPGSLSRMRGRVPMAQGMRDFMLGRFGPMQVRR